MNNPLATIVPEEYLRKVAEARSSFIIIVATDVIGQLARNQAALLDGENTGGTVILLLPEKSVAKLYKDLSGETEVK